MKDWDENLFRIFVQVKPVLVILFSLPTLLFSQELADTTYDLVYPSNYSLGIHFNTAGWGVYGELGRQKNYKYDNTYGFSVSNIRHKNEFKISGATGTRSYYYKKINSFVVLRPSFGGNLLLFEAKREDGIGVYFKWRIGPAFGFLKPVYLDIIKQQNIGINPIPEKYNPDIHENAVIEGKARWTKGVSEGNFEFGAATKAGFNFNFAKDKSAISGGEVGFMVDYFPVREVKLMYGANNFRLFSAFYLQFELGSRF